MRKFHLFLLIVSIFTMSCQKEISTELGNNGNAIVQPSDTAKLNKIVAFDTTQIPGQDTLYTIQFFYDNLKRLDRHLIIYYDGPSIRDTTEITKFRYNGADTLPFVRESIYPGNSPFVSTGYDTIYFTYSPSQRNRIIQDSIRTGFSMSPDLYASVKSYNYSNQGILVYRNEYLNGVLQNQDSYTIYQTMLNGNIIKQHDTIRGTIRDYSIEYDNKPNPIPKVVRLYPNFSFPVLDYFFNNASNNIVNYRSSELHLGSTAREEYQLSYRYNSSGYPIEVTMVDILFPTEVIKLKYYY